jgi:hypothetical protein
MQYVNSKIWEEPNPLGICYKNDLTTELKVGDYVEVNNGRFSYFLRG